MLAGFLLLLGVYAKPSGFTLISDSGISPMGQTSWESIYRTPEGGWQPCNEGEDGCVPCFGEDNRWARVWRGDLNGEFTTDPMVFCSWGGVGLVIKAYAPRRFDLTVTGSTGSYIVPTHDLGIVDGYHTYVHCFWAGGHAPFWKGPDNPWTVSIAANAKNVTLEVSIMPDSPYIQRANCPEVDWT